MKIDCETNPKDFIEKIGDPNFHICDETYDSFYQHKDNPYTLRIRDCEDNLSIDITGETPEDSLQIAKALCKLLNQDYGIHHEN